MLLCLINLVEGNDIVVLYDAEHLDLIEHRLLYKQNNLRETEVLLTMFFLVFLTVDFLIVFRA